MVEVRGNQNRVNPTLLELETILEEVRNREPLKRRVQTGDSVTIQRVDPETEQPLNGSQPKVYHIKPNPHIYKHGMIKRLSDPEHGIIFDRTRLAQALLGKSLDNIISLKIDDYGNEVTEYYRILDIIQSQ